MRNCVHKIATRGLAFKISCALFLFARLAAAAQPQMLRMCPNTGPEGTRVQVIGQNLQNSSAVLFGKTQAAFHSVSPERLIAIVPHKVSTAIITVITPQGKSSGSSPFVVSNDPRIPEEVSYKAGYVNPIPHPAGFESARLWGIAIADTRMPGSESAAGRSGLDLAILPGRRQRSCPQ